MSEPDPIYLEDRTAGAYLSQAKDALIACGNRSKLYGMVAAVPEEIDLRIQFHFAAQSKQLEFARTSILFSALAAEAYINGFLLSHLTPADFDSIDRMRTVDKYVIAPELALGRRLFERGADPAQTIHALFTLRDRLVHPKVKKLRVERGTFMDPRFADFNPQSAARFLVQVGAAAVVLRDNTMEEKTQDPILDSISTQAVKFMEFGAAMTRGLPEPVGEPIRIRRTMQKRTRENSLFAAMKRGARFDPLQVPPTVPQDPMALYEHLAALPGTATGPLPPPSRERSPE